MIRLRAFFVASFALGCRSEPSPTEPDAVEPAPLAEPGPDTGPATPEAEPEAPKDAAPDQVVDTLSFTKGAQPVLGGLILDADDFEERFGEGWRETLAGLKLRARGRRDVYRCGPMEQCLTTGSIPFLRDVTTIVVCDTKDARARGIATLERC